MQRDKRVQCTLLGKVVVVFLIDHTVQERAIDSLFGL